MRTTVTLDADVVAKLEAVARERGISFKQALNEVVRAGLNAGCRSAASFEQYTQPMGLRPGLQIAKVLQLAALEGEEIIRTLDLRT